MTVSELLARVSSKELTEWMAYYEIEPFGANANYLGHAITASTIANVNRKKGTKPFKVDQFMPKFDKKKTQSAEDMIAIAAQFTAMLGGEDKR